MELKRFHATSIVFDNCGILITGKSGFGKSDLALRLIDSGATLISDDQTICKKKNGEIFLFSPKETKGLLEVREVGIITVPYVEDVKLAMVVNLVDIEGERMPENKMLRILGVKVPKLKINAMKPSSVVKVKVKLNEIREIK